MPIWNVTGWLLIGLNVLIILLTHLFLAKLSLMLPNKWFENDGFWYRTFKWEKNGKIYETVFKIKIWKKFLPDGAKLFNYSFEKKLNETDANYLKRFILETRRAEFSHLIQILPSMIFYLFNPLYSAIIITLYFIGFNLPPILSQRHTRPRLKKLLLREQRKALDK
jgi:glycosyl-4,4'-diaponeurosporenoate acyltransferase